MVATFPPALRPAAARWRAAHAFALLDAASTTCGSSRPTRLLAERWRARARSSWSRSAEPKSGALPRLSDAERSTLEPVRAVVGALPASGIRCHLGGARSPGRSHPPERARAVDVHRADSPGDARRGEKGARGGQGVRRQPAACPSPLRGCAIAARPFRALTARRRRGGPCAPSAARDPTSAAASLQASTALGAERRRGSAGAHPTSPPFHRGRALLAAPTAPRARPQIARWCGSRAASERGARRAPCGRAPRARARGALPEPRARPASRVGRRAPEFAALLRRAPAASRCCVRARRGSSAQRMRSMPGHARMRRACCATAATAARRWAWSGPCPRARAARAATLAAPLLLTGPAPGEEEEEVGAD